MRIPRFYCPAAVTANPGDIVELDERESHHLEQVLRRRTGDAVRILTGAGDEWEGVVAAVGARTRVRLDRRRATPAPAQDRAPVAHRFTAGVAVALARGGAFELALEHLAELGADEIVPLVCERCVVRLPRPGDTDNKTRRWRRILESAAKQSGRRTIPALHEPLEFPRWIERETATQGTSESISTGLWIAAPEAAEPTLFEQVAAWIRRRTAEWTVDPSDTEPIGRILVAIGPEGGFSPEEMELAARLAVPRALLEENTLRVATAAAAAITLIRLAIRHAAS